MGHAYRNSPFQFRIQTLCRTLRIFPFPGQSFFARGNGKQICIDRVNAVNNSHQAVVFAVNIAAAAHGTRNV